MEQFKAKRSQKFQSTHSLRSATALADLDMVSMWVSIHALLAECDLKPPTRKENIMKFQSTHSLRSATIERHKIMSIYTVSIHALLAECDYSTVIYPTGAVVSIHALLAECDFGFFWP